MTSCYVDGKILSKLGSGTDFCRLSDSVIMAMLITEECGVLFTPDAVDGCQTWSIVHRALSYVLSMTLTNTPTIIHLDTPL